MFRTTIDSTQRGLPVIRMSLSFAWKIGLPLVAALFCVVGCNEGQEESSWMPAPVNESPPYEISGRGIMAWGDTFKMNRITDVNKELHQCIIIGVDTPKSGQSFYNRATVGVNTLIRKKKLEFRVVRRDQWNHECGFVYQDGLDVGLELIRLGLGWYDGEEFPGDDAYRLAEEEARSKRIGLWSENNPIPPWDFHEQQQSEFNERLSKD